MSTDGNGPSGSKTEQAKEFFQSVADGVTSGIKASGEMLVEHATTVAETVADGGKVLLDGLSGGAKTLLENIEHTGEMVVEQVSGAVGYLQDGVYYVGGKAVEGTVMVKDGVISVGENIVGTIINTSRFVSDHEYREDVGIPWLQGVINSNRETLAYQMEQNGKAMDVLYRYSSGETLTEEEIAEATKQLNDMIKLVPALAIFLVPGGSLLLPVLAKLLPWEVFPDLRSPEQKVADEKEAAVEVKVSNEPVPNPNKSHEPSSKS